MIKISAGHITILILLSLTAMLAVADNSHQDEKTARTDIADAEEIIDIKDRGGDFSLIGKDGWVSLSDFRNKVVAIYFGYTKCPDVCPTNLSFLSSAIAQLSPEEKKHFQSIFISVDPGRDSPNVLVEYVKYFDPEMIGLSAAPDDLDPVVAQYGAFYEKIPYSNSALMYGVDHTSETYIVGKDGKLLAIMPHATESLKILQTIRSAIKKSLQKNSCYVFFQRLL